MDFSKASSAASMQVSAMTDRFWRFIENQHSVNNPLVYMELCLSLARGIDHAIANNGVPSVACDLPSLLREVHKCKSYKSFQVQFMLLMFSVKSACKNGWFTEKDADDLLLLAEEVKGVFSSEVDINVEPSYALTFVSIVMSRFYPHMKMDKIIVSVQAKPGFHAHLVDFQISRNLLDIQKEKIKLFVARSDNMDTSSCIISAPEVSFLLNGRGVPGRINISMKNGPQLPTNVTAMLKYGTNLLQAIGTFDGPYIIVIATMSRLPSLSTTVLQDYDQSVLDSGTSSVVSLNCPISQRRIRVPVKGHLCKHYQCFDYDTYLATNLRQPSWQCPHCKLSVCHLDLRVDQNIAKVLREVGEDVLRVVFRKDGSWLPVQEKKDPSSQPSVRSTSSMVGDQVLPSVVSSDGKTQTAAKGHVAQDHLSSLAQMTKNMGRFTAPGSSGSSFAHSTAVPKVDGYDTLHSGFHVNTPQAPNLASSFLQHRPLSQMISDQAVQSRTAAHPFQGSASVQNNSNATRMYRAMNPSQNSETSPLLGRVSQFQLRGSLQRQPWLTQAPNLSQNPFNSPVPSRTTPVQQRDGLLQPTWVNRAKNQPQNPSSTPVRGQQAQGERRDGGSQLAASAVADSFSMENAGGSSGAAGGASDPNWRPSKRMRGSLTGEAYSAALSQFLSPPPAPAVVRAPRLQPPPGFFPNLAVVSPFSGAPSSSEDQRNPNPNPNPNPNQ